MYLYVTGAKCSNYNKYGMEKENGGDTHYSILSNRRCMLCWTKYFLVKRLFKSER